VWKLIRSITLRQKGPDVSCLLSSFHWETVTDTFLCGGLTDHSVCVWTKRFENTVRHIASCLWLNRTSLAMRVFVCCVCVYQCTCLLFVSLWFLLCVRGEHLFARIRFIEQSRIKFCSHIRCALPAQILFNSQVLFLLMCWCCRVVRRVGVLMCWYVARCVDDIVLMCWELCWCADVLLWSMSLMRCLYVYVGWRVDGVDALMCWSHCVDVLMLWCVYWLDDSVLMCWCVGDVYGFMWKCVGVVYVDNCVDLLMCMGLCVFVLVSMSWCWCVCNCVDVSIFVAVLIDEFGVLLTMCCFNVFVGCLLCWWLCWCVNVLVCRRCWCLGALVWFASRENCHFFISKT
jgi:hypothetical protein